MSKDPQYKDAEFMRHPDGVILLDGVEVAHTMHCVHGNHHWIARKGSGIRRGFCTNCMGITCGSPLHLECIRGDGHFMNKIELYEKGKLQILR